MYIKIVGIGKIEHHRLPRIIDNEPYLINISIENDKWGKKIC
jgi:hypothetical protein